MKMTNTISRVISCNDSTDEESTIRREWLTTNGLGGFASGTLSGSLSRRYHGLLVAALPAPLGRTVMLSRLQEKLIIGNETHFLNDQELIDNPASKSCLYLKEFRLDMGLPVWVYQIENFTLEKRILLERARNTLLINYTLLEAPSSLDIELRPAVHFRALEAPVNQDSVNTNEYTLIAKDNTYQVRGGNYPPLYMRMLEGDHSFNIDNHRWDNIYFRLEYERGYESVGKYWSPGFFKFSLPRNQSITLVATTEDVENLPLSFAEVFTAEIKRRNHLLASAAVPLQHDQAAELVLAADQFIITPAGRSEETKSVRVPCEEAKTIIAGYHWFTELHEEKDLAGAIKMRAYAERARHSFNARFWNRNSGYLYDVIDGPAGLDDSCRPNQIFSIALPHPVLDREHWPAVVSKVEEHLLTPVGLRCVRAHTNVRLHTDALLLVEEIRISPRIRSNCIPDSKMVSHLKHLYIRGIK